MAQTPSTMLPLGTPMPSFRLTDTTRAGVTVADTDLAGRPASVVAFICNHCPFVHHIRPVLASVTGSFIDRGVGVVGISSNDPAGYPDDAPDKMAAEARAHGYRFPYLFDADQSVAKAFAAACTPDFYVFDGSRRLVYRGQFDASRPSGKRGGNNLPVTGADLVAAVEAVLAGRPVSATQWPSIGCNIKWRPGNEPAYFGV